jgi:hypothetical protein
MLRGSGHFHDGLNEGEMDEKRAEMDDAKVQKDEDFHLYQHLLCYPIPTLSKQPNRSTKEKVILTMIQIQIPLRKQKLLLPQLLPKPNSIFRLSIQRIANTNNI